MRLVRFGPSELIVLDSGPRTRCGGAAHEVLQLPAASHVTREHVELSIRTERHHAAIVIASLGLSCVLLNRANGDDVAIERHASLRPR